MEQQYLIKATQQRTNQVRFFDRYSLLVIKALAQPYDEVTARRIATQAIAENIYPTHDLAVIPDDGISEESYARCF